MEGTPPVTWGGEAPLRAIFLSCKTGATCGENLVHGECSALG